MNDPNLIILAGGISSRMKKSIEARSRTDPQFASDLLGKTKAMITVGATGRPFLDYLLYNARETGYEDILIVVSERDRSMKDYYGGKESNNSFHGLRISYATQFIPEGRTKPLGTADALLQGMKTRREWSGRKFTVCNSDNLYSKRALRILLESPHRNALIDYDRDSLGFPPARVSQFSITQKDGDGFLTKILEKPTAADVEAARGKSGTVSVSMNIFRFEYDDIRPAVESVPLHPVRYEKELPAAVSIMVRQNPKSLYAFPLAERVPDMTSIEDLERVREYIQTEFGTLTW